jgi:hypothetical protein
VDLVAFAVKRRGLRLNEQPSAALTSRVVIGQAKGVIFGRAGVDLPGLSPGCRPGVSSVFPAPGSCTLVLVPAAAGLGRARSGCRR